jgi:8-oxo-dGTP diphosphatase
VDLRSDPSLHRHQRGLSKLTASPTLVGNWTVLRSARLALRPLTTGDRAAVESFATEWRLAADPRDAKPMSGGESVADWLLEVEKARARGECLTYAIERQPETEFIGTISLRFAEGEPIGEIGYWIGRAFQRRGYAAEAIERLLRYAFDTLKLDEVRAAAASGNLPSINLLRKLGMTEGEHPDSAASDIRMWSMRRDRPAARPGSTAAVVLVAAVALVDGDGRVLLAQRPPGKAMAGLWEFPGGKVKPGETPEAALIREIKEELGIDVTASCLAPFTFASHAYADFHLLMPLYVCRKWQGTVRPLEGQALAWVRPARLGEYAMPPADKPLVAMLRDLL